jgi:hypothetical protein
MCYGGSCGSGSGWLFSSHLLCSKMDMACWMAIVLMFIHVCLISECGIFRLSRIKLSEWVCVVAQALAVITISRAIVHQWLHIQSRSGRYFVVLFVIVSKENLSLQ